jgi:hypothetical protein
MAEAAEDLVTLTNRQIWIGAIGLGAILVTIILSIRATRAAENQVRLSREALIAEQRAWLFVTLSAEGDFTSSEEHGGYLNVAANIANIGRTPALYVSTEIEMIFDLWNLPERLAAFCREKKTLNTKWGRSLLAGDSYTKPWALHTERKEMGEVNDNGWIFPCIIGCVTYQILPDKSLHQTGFVYTVTEVAGQVWQIPVRPIILGKTTSQADVMLEVGPGGFAD